MRAKDVMTSPVHTVGPGTTVQDAVQLMTTTSVAALPVVDGDRLVGMVSEGDLLRHRVPSDPTASLRRLPADPDIGPRTVAEAMSPRPLTTEPAADLAEVAEKLLDGDVRSMPVLEDGRVVGIVSRRDILRAMVRGDDVLTMEVQHRLDEYGGTPQRWTATVEGGVVTVHGVLRDETERAVVAVLARTVPGVSAVHLPAPGETTA
jgi:CBS domain-containing protein